MASKITDILEILSDGKWHGMEELQQKMQLSEHQTREITAFLNQYNFVRMNRTNKKIRIDKNVREFLTQTTT
jgi:DNA-binding IclR family transcriptional regulator